MAVTPLMSCDDDDDYSSSPNRPDYSKNRVYMLNPDEEYSTIEYKASGAFIESLENPLVLTQIRCTRPAPENVTVVAEIDPTLVAEYNQANDTDYAMMEGAKLVTTKFEIPRGEFMATEKLAIDFSDHSALAGSEKNLVLPVAITSVTGGLVISKQSRFFIVFDYEANELTPVSQLSIDVDVTESGWQSAYTNYVVKDFISAEWDAEFAVTVNATVDNSLIASYNAANGTDYKELSVTPQPITLAKGTSKADLSLRLGNYTAVSSDVTYLVPMRLSIASGEGAALSTDIVYVVVRKMPVILSYVLDAQPSDADPVYPTGWTRIQYQDSWYCSMTRDGETANWSNFVKDGAGQYIFTGDIIEVNFGTPTTVGGMSIQFYAWYWGMSSINTIKISNDGTNWIDVEGCYFQNDYPHIACLRFNKPTTFQYMRFTFGGYNYPEYGNTDGGFLQLISFWNI